MPDPAGLIDPRRRDEIYKAFLKLDEISDLIAVCGEPQIFLDHMVGFYLEDGEDALHDPRTFSRVMQFRDALLRAEGGDFSGLPRLGTPVTQYDAPGYDALADMIRLRSDTAKKLSGMAKQILEALPTVLETRPING